MIFIVIVIDVTNKIIMEIKKDYILSDTYELCYSAYRNTSFSPERRAEQTIKSYSQELEEDLKELGEKQGNYKEKYIRYFKDWMSAKGRCISSMITGPANFPIRAAEKYNRSEHNKYESFQKWRDKYHKAVNRVKTPSPEEELDTAMKRLDALVIRQGIMKEMNKIIKKEIKKDFIMDELIKKLKAEEYPDEMIADSLKEGWYGYGYPGFTLTNNNSTIKRTREKIIIMKNRIQTKGSFEDIKFSGGHITIEDDRVKIYHDEKPEKGIIIEIKTSGFRWSPNWKCWCRKHTVNALTTVSRLSFIK